ncbi:MAG TPA: glycosyltransferase family 2 protein, partial [Candidatus Nanopelagicales bacterium]|nr:glycosyltransferase family 2 protein [Candidatus Nanopelagicales bacterium]
DLLSSAAVIVDERPAAALEDAPNEPAPFSPPPLAAPLAERAPALVADKPQVSLVVPGLNESESLPELAERVHQALGGRVAYELIFVDDGSTDDTWKVICELRAKNPLVKGIRLRKNFGKATALTAGFRKARGDVIVTMDADLQDDPADLPNFLAKIEEGLDVVVGWKVHRLDPANRLVLSRIFNGTVRWVTGVKLHDMNCGFKAYREEVIRAIPIYGDLFRFIPALAASQGFRVAEIPIKHHARRYGSSRYGLERVLRGFFDLLSVLFLTRYSKKPMHLFGLMGLLFAALGVCINAYLTVLWFFGHRIGDRPLLLLGVLMIILGIQFFSMGFIGEFLTFQMQQRSMRDDPPIREELE